MNYFINVSKLIFDLGGTGSVAKRLDINPSTISNWKKNNKIPTAYSNKISNLVQETSSKKIINNQTLE